MNNPQNSNDQKAGPQSTNVGNAEQTPEKNAPGQDQQPGKTGESQQDTSKQNSESPRP